MNALSSNAPAYSSLNIATLSQQARLLRLDNPLNAELVVEHLNLREGVSRLFSLTLDCLAASAEVDVSALLGKEISVSLLQADGAMRRWHAVVEGVDALGADGGLARFRLHAAPWMAALALRRDSFIYQDLSVQDIVSEVFSDYPQAAFAFELSQALEPLAVCTQYRESDLAFVERILTEAGLSYRFEHQQDEGQSASGGGRPPRGVMDPPPPPPPRPPPGRGRRGHEPVGPEDLVDAFGEVANVVGGNVKALLPHPGTLGLPQVAPALPDLPGTALAHELRLDWHGRPIVVVVWLA